MLNLPEKIALPLKTDEQGNIRVSGTRVTLDSILRFYLQGSTPEELHEGFPTVPITDIYIIIAYYLANQGDIDRWLQVREIEAERSRSEWEARYTPEQKARAEYFRKLLASGDSYGCL